jgi:hypothetical protein
MNTYQDKFKCTGCGCCCKRIDKVLAIAETLPEDMKEDLAFPYSHNNGVCEKLNEEGKCSIYNERPLICNFEESRKYFGFTDYEFNKIVVPSCNEMMEEDNVSPEFKIILT